VLGSTWTAKVATAAAPDTVSTTSFSGRISGGGNASSSRPRTGDDAEGVLEMDALNRGETGEEGDPPPPSAEERAVLAAEASWLSMSIGGCGRVFCCSSCSSVSSADAAAALPFTRPVAGVDGPESIESDRALSSYR